MCVPIDRGFQDCTAFPPKKNIDALHNVPSGNLTVRY